MTHFERMLQMADEVFDARHDPQQLQVDESVIRTLQSIHPDAVVEASDEAGPYLWIIFIPTTTDRMQQFLSGTIGESELIQTEALDQERTALYLCSVMLLPEYRGKGIALTHASKAIQHMQMRFPISQLFYWPFSNEGRKSARGLASMLSMPLAERTK